LDAGSMRWWSGMFTFVVNRNFVKLRSERTARTREPRHAGRPREVPVGLAMDFSPGGCSRTGVLLPDLWKILYQRDWSTPVIPSNTRHRLVYAF